MRPGAAATRGRSLSRHPAAAASDQPVSTIAAEQAERTLERALPRIRQSLPAAVAARARAQPTISPHRQHAAEHRNGRRLPSKSPAAPRSMQHSSKTSARHTVPTPATSNAVRAGRRRVRRSPPRPDDQQRWPPPPATRPADSAARSARRNRGSGPAASTSRRPARCRTSESAARTSDSASPADSGSCPAAADRRRRSENCRCAATEQAQQRPTAAVPHARQAVFAADQVSPEHESRRDRPSSIAADQMIPVQRSARGGQGVDAPRDRGIFDQRRRVVRLRSGHRSPAVRGSPSACAR